MRNIFRATAFPESFSACFKGVFSLHQKVWMDVVSAAPEEASNWINEQEEKKDFFFGRRVPSRANLHGRSCIPPKNLEFEIENRSNCRTILCLIMLFILYWSFSYSDWALRSYLFGSNWSLASPFSLRRWPAQREKFLVPMGRAAPVSFQPFRPFLPASPKKNFARQSFLIWPAQNSRDRESLLHLFSLLRASWVRGDLGNDNKPRGSSRRGSGSNLLSTALK